ncbi:MAG: hypothetical protein Q9182_007307 [Xanthomendoza sp. 2 TL-2023]
MSDIYNVWKPEHGHGPEGQTLEQAMATFKVFNPSMTECIALQKALKPGVIQTNATANNLPKRVKLSDSGFGLVIMIGIPVHLCKEWYPLDFNPAGTALQSPAREHIGHAFMVRDKSSGDLAFAQFGNEKTRTKMHILHGHPSRFTPQSPVVTIVRPASRAKYEASPGPSTLQKSTSRTGSLLAVMHDSYETAPTPDNSTPDKPNAKPPTKIEKSEGKGPVQPPSTPSSPTSKVPRMTDDLPQLSPTPEPKASSPESPDQPRDFTDLLLAMALAKDYANYQDMAERLDAAVMIGAKALQSGIRALRIVMPEINKVIATTDEKVMAKAAKSLALDSDILKIHYRAMKAGLEQAQSLRDECREVLEKSCPAEAERVFSHEEEFEPSAATRLLLKEVNSSYEDPGWDINSWYDVTKGYNVANTVEGREV